MSSSQQSAGNYKYVVLGGGNAAGYVARSFAQLGCQGMLRIISEESCLPYERSLLSKRLDPQDECRHLINEQTEEWYTEQGFSVCLNTHVKSVDISRKLLRTSSGDFPYEKLIVATGSAPLPVRIAGANLGEVYCLRGQENKRDIQDAIATAKHRQPDEAKAVVIGHNYIAMETAAAIAQAGLETCVVLEAEQFIPDLLPRVLAEEFQRLFELERVTLIKRVKVKELLPRANCDDMVGCVRLEDGRDIHCSFCVLIQSTKPRVSLFRQLLAIDEQSGGLLVDSHLRTSNRDIYAIGDVCAFPQFYDGKPGRWPRADHAIRSAHYVAYSVLADEFGRAHQLEDYWYLPHTSSVVFNRHWDFFGRPYGDCRIIGSLFYKQAGFAAVFTGPDRRIEGIFLEEGSQSDLEVLRKVARFRPQLSDNQYSELSTMTSAQSFLHFLRMLCDKLPEQGRGGQKPWSTGEQQLWQAGQPQQHLGQQYSKPFQSEQQQQQRPLEQLPL